MNRQTCYISAASTISHQPTFQNPGFSKSLETLAAESALLSPDYKAFIDAALLRRMSKILRMSVACAKDCIAQAGIEQPDAIVVGTGLGCLQDTEKFLNTALTVEGLLPPTSFIQSTHNTMAGQISLSLGNHGYNMTHTQNALSFEHALLDAMLLLAEGDENVLVGAADENIPLLETIREKLNLQITGQLTSGASFFVLSNERKENTKAILRDTAAIGLTDNVSELIHNFLQNNDTTPDQIDLMLYPENAPALSAGLRGVAYLPYSGVYPTASAFALHYAVDQIAHVGAAKKVLVCNSLRDKYVGLTLIEALEA